MMLIRSISIRCWWLALSSALLQVLLFPTDGPVSPLLGFVSWVSLVPFFVALLLPTKSDRPLLVRQAAILGYFCGILWYLGNCSWIYQTMYLYGGMPKPVALGVLILFALYLGLYHALFASLLVWMRRTRLGVLGALAAAPFLWVAVELARARITGFPWDLLGYARVDNLFLTRIAPVAGVMSISFVIAAVNALIAAYFFAGRRGRLLLPAAALMLVVVVEAVPLFVKVPVEKTNQFAVMMQENLAVGAMAKSVEPIAPEDELQEFSAMTVREALKVQPTVLLWPEAPSHLFSYDPNFRQQIGLLAKATGAPAIIGSLGIDRTDANARGYYKYDSASLFDATGAYRGRYDKVHLVPWGEYVPYSAFFGSLVTKLTEGAGDMDAGTQRTVFTARGHAYGVFVCYESIFGTEVREFAKNGAEVLVNISDDGWYGDTGAPWQHLNMARMRAIENHRWLLRDTNTGLTTAIDPYGRMPQQAPRHTRGAYAFPFAFEQGTTFYTRHGDWFAWLCAFVSLVAVAFGLAGSKPKVQG